MHKTRWVLVGVTAATMTLCGPAAGTSAPAPHSSITVPATRGSVYDASAILTGPVTVGHIIEPVSACPRQPRGARIRRAGVLRLRDGPRLHRHVRAGRRPLVDQTVDVGLLQDEDHRSPAGLRREVQRHRGGRVDERLGRRVGSRLGLPQSHARARRVRLRGCVGPGARCRRGARPSSVSAARAGLVQEEPSRYGTLHHPGDQYALDMFAQIGRALRSTQSTGRPGPAPPTPRGGGGRVAVRLLPHHFADAIQPNTHAFDGIFIHSRGGGGDGTRRWRTGLSGGLRIRTDLTCRCSCSRPRPI